MSLTGVKALLLDLDGVLYVEGEPIAGAQEAVRALRQRTGGLRFVTNTTQRSRRQTLEKLDRLGFGVQPEELVTPAALARRRCEEAGHSRIALIMNEALHEDFEGMDDVGEAESGADAVVMGDLGERFGFPILNRAFRLVMDGAELIALQKNRFWLTADGLSLDEGPFVAAIEYATGRDAYVVGKPSPGFFSQILGGLGVEPGDTAMVGDDVETDVGGAMDAGLAGVLVRTGKYREQFVRESGVQATITVDSIADVPELFAA